MFIDEITITFQAGRGGDGKVSFYPGRKGGPNGGSGGKGGNILVFADKKVESLSHLAKKRLIKAFNGQSGESFSRKGSNGDDVTVVVPCNTTLEDQKTKDTFTLSQDSEILTVCKGGVGGEGNEFFKSATNRAPHFAQKGKMGEKKTFRIIVKIIAQVGLIGLPNAGKSSVLNTVTNANVKTAPYPFTTLEPNLGVCGDKIIADIPGLIEGASLGKGLGYKFLRHIEKVDTLIHCISCESQSVKKDYETVRQELKNYNGELMKKNEIILLTKTDLSTPQNTASKKQELEKLGCKVLTCSIYDKKSIEAFMNLLESL